MRLPRLKSISGTLLQMGKKRGRRPHVANVRTIVQATTGERWQARYLGAKKPMASYFNKKTGACVRTDCVLEYVPKRGAKSLWELDTANSKKRPKSLQETLKRFDDACKKNAQKGATQPIWLKACQRGVQT